MSIEQTRRRAVRGVTEKAIAGLRRAKVRDGYAEYDPDGELVFLDDVLDALRVNRKDWDAAMAEADKEWRP